MPVPPTSISAATITSQAMPIEMRMPVRMVGAAAGRMTRNALRSGFTSSVLATSSHSRRTAPAPESLPACPSSFPSASSTRCRRPPPWPSAGWRGARRRGAGRRSRSRAGSRGGSAASRNLLDGEAGEVFLGLHRVELLAHHLELRVARGRRLHVELRYALLRLGDEEHLFGDALVVDVALVVYRAVVEGIGAEEAVDVAGAQVRHHLRRRRDADLDVGVGIETVLRHVVAQQEVVHRVLEGHRELEALPGLRIALVLVP